jgi:hypothetical protein
MAANTLALQSFSLDSTEEGNNEPADADPGQPSSSSHSTALDDRVRRRILAQYEMVPDQLGELCHRPVLAPIPVGGGESGADGRIRYRDSAVVSTKGQRYLEVPKAAEPENTFVNIRVKTKGKRGPGFK